MSEIRGGEEVAEQEACLFAMSLVTWAVPFHVVKAIMDLNVFEIIKRSGPTAQLSAAEIAAQLGTPNPDAASVLDRMLRLLAAFSVVSSSLRPLSDGGGGSERVYGLAPVCKYLTKNEDGASFAPASFISHDRVLTQVWNNLKDAVVEGGDKPIFNKTHGMGFFEYMGTDARFRDGFYQGMRNHTAIVVKKMVGTYKGFGDLTSLVDVGGGNGDALKMIVSKYPNIKAINFDLPHVIQNAPSYPGVEHVGGDMYVSVPRADAIFMKFTMHIANDEECLRVLKNCHAALPDNGKVIGCEYLVPDEPEPSLSAKIAYTFDNLMMAVPGGRERTKHEYESLGKQAGFQAFQLVCFVCGSCIMEFLK
ncbi:hypothetical protein Cgig2_012505 [Carnegiea gigantea]|uniref:Uncharacterized protein n=1 Tax=Carnegiea gigantea TaxID=171969 RepID=A0A9Q1QD88_9CARY|nr:hypothetical protein Cgig2_012505 [Carnegiea gigantea]